MKITFDSFYDDYDDWYETPVGKFIDTIQTNSAFKLLQPSSLDSVLDVGCGTGNYTLKLSELVSSVVGVDVSKNMLALAKEKAKKLNENHPDRQLSFLKMSSYSLDFPDNSFDKVISMAAFEFIYRPKDALDEIFRVLKPGGTVVIGSIQKNSNWYDLYTSPIFDGSAYDDACFKSKTEMIELAKTKFVNFDECLFTPPALAESEYTNENESNYKKTLEVGGFICLKFQKEI